MPLLVTRETAALELGVSSKTIDRLITRGVFKPCRIGKRVQIPFDQLEKFAKGDHPNG
jgi:excisionase family DNA binding protein